MYALLTIVFFVAALFSSGDTERVIGFSIVAGLFAIASAISSIYSLMAPKPDNKESQK